MDFLCEVGLVRGQVRGQVRELTADHRTDTGDQREGKHDHGDYGNHAIDVPTSQQQDGRPERKAQWTERAIGTKTSRSK
jgi:hypothetical protein